MTDQQRAAEGQGLDAGHAPDTGRAAGAGPGPGADPSVPAPGDGPLRAGALGAQGIGPREGGVRQAGVPDAAPGSGGTVPPARETKPHAPVGTAVGQDAPVRENGTEDEAAAVRADGAMGEDTAAPGGAGGHTDGRRTAGRPGKVGDPPRGGGAPTDEDTDLARDQGPFRRDRRYKVLGGVCSGLARHCDMDPVIFRIVLAVLSATGGIGLIFYGFVWLLVPYEDDEENEVRKLLTGRVDGPGLAAVLFALVGCGAFLSMLRNGGLLTFAAILSLLLAGAGYWSRQRGAPDPDPLAAQAAAEAPPEATAPPAPTARPSWWRDPIVKDGTHVGGTGYLWGPSDLDGRDATTAVADPPGPPFGQRTERRATPRPPGRRGPRWIGGWVTLLALLAGALGTGLTWQVRPLGTSLETGLASALVVLGLGIAVSSFLGRTGAGSIFLAILTAGLLATAAALPKDIGTHWSRTTWTPASVAAVRESYDLGTGVGTLDLSHVRLSEGRTVTTRAEVGVGRLKVVLPKDSTAELKIDTGIGDIQLPGDAQKDVDVQPGRHRQITLRPAPGTKSVATFELSLNVGLGQVEVTHAAS
ncbi:PspC domain-containing protein [Streptomyces nodosus]|uniref:PspC domain-containing protein n=1 Tax=Streptomyces nodosus TaxID=40318 RepID=UPI0034547088